jgi:uncharacterized membrane protein YdjX (TVP38/TMEM64 family)
VRKLKKSAWFRLVAGMCLTGGLVAVFYFSPLRHYLTFDNIVWSVQTARVNGWSLPVFYCIFILAVLALPLTLFPVIGGVLFGFWLALPLNILACTIGALIAFQITRFFGRDVVERLLRGKWKMLDHIAAVDGVKTVTIMRLLGIPPFIIQNYALGLSSVNVRDYLLGTVLGIAPWMALITFASHALWNAVLLGGKKEFAVALFKLMGPLSLLSIGVAVMMALTYRIKKRRAKAADHSNL